MSNDKIYADGLFGGERERQPDFVVGNLAIVKDKFIAWLQAQPADDKGWIRLNVLRQKADALKWSVSVDDWKPSAPEPAGTNGSAPPEDDFDF